jgi:1,4-dihydroxy-6-naphthoate synthase
MVVQTNEISVAHSPDSDDAFMFYAIAENKLDTSNFRIKQVMKDIQTLNQEAADKKYEVSAISWATNTDRLWSPNAPFLIKSSSRA